MSISSDLLTREQLDEASKVDVLDKDGYKHSFGDLIRGKKVAVVFIRHYCKSPYSSFMSFPPNLMFRVWYLSSIRLEASKEYSTWQSTFGHI